MKVGRYIDGEFVEYTEMELVIVELVMQSLRNHTTSDEGAGWHGGNESVKEHVYDSVADDILQELINIGIINS